MKNEIQTIKKIDELIGIDNILIDENNIMYFNVTGLYEKIKKDSELLFYIIDYLELDNLESEFDIMLTVNKEGERIIMLS